MLPLQFNNVGDSKNIFFLKTTLDALVYLESPGMYVSYCPMLDLYSQGDTEEQAEKNILEATGLLIECCIKNRTLETVLKECGFNSVNRELSKTKLRKKDKLPPESKIIRKFTISPEWPVMVHG